MRATVRLDTASHAGPIDRRIFGGFLEHLGRAVYGGVYEPGNPLSDARGFRTDVLDAVRGLNLPLVRYPGGNFVSSYDWRDGVGPRERRPLRHDPAWKALETNAFGIDEFVDWCGQAKTAPMLAVNLGTLRGAEAAEQVAYCNLRGGSIWSDQRAGNGRREPHAVKVWCLGNEMDGPWQAGHAPVQEYARRAREAARLMRQVDPGIELIACGSTDPSMKTYLEWDRAVLEACWDEIDHIAPHRYAENLRGDSAWFLAEGVFVDRIIDDFAKLLDSVRRAKGSERRVTLAFDEWNVWYRDYPTLKETYNVEDALVVAQFLNSFIRHADVVKIACLAQLVNVIAPIVTRPDGVLLQTIYHPFRLISANARGLSLTPRVDGPAYKAGERGEVPALDVSASFDAAGETAAVFLVNRSAGEADVAVQFDDRRVRDILGAQELHHPDLKSANTWEEPGKVAPRPALAFLEGHGVRVRVPGPGFVALRLGLDRRNI